MRRLFHTLWASAPRWVRRLFVWWQTPHFIVSVAAAIINEEGQILLADHVFRKGQSWGMPGGFLEKGEDPEEAVRRELREELGVELTDVSVGLVRTFPATRQVEIVYRCRLDGTPKIDSVELRKVGWFFLDDLPEVTRDQKALIERVVRSDRS